MDFEAGTYDYFVEAITEYRKKHNITQKDFGSPAGLDQKTLSARERKQTQFTLEEAIAICKSFGLSLDELCGLKPNAGDGSMFYSEILEPIFKAASVMPANVIVKTDDKGMLYADLHSPDDYRHPQKYYQAQVIINIPGRYWSEALPEWDKCRMRSASAASDPDMDDAVKQQLRKGLDEMSRKLLEYARQFKPDFAQHMFVPYDTK